MEGNLVRFQANQGNPPRRREAQWWCFMPDCGKSNPGLRSTCRACGHDRYHALHPVVRDLKRKLDDAEHLIRELLTKQAKANTT